MVMRQCNVCGGLSDLNDVAGSAKFIVIQGRQDTPFLLPGQMAPLRTEEYDLCRDCASAFVALMASQLERLRAGK